MNLFIKSTAVFIKIWGERPQGGGNSGGGRLDPTSAYSTCAFYIPRKTMNAFLTFKVSNISKRRRTKSRRRHQLATSWDVLRTTRTWTTRQWSHRSDPQLPFQLRRCAHFRVQHRLKRVDLLLQLSITWRDVRKSNVWRQQQKRQPISVVDDDN